MKILWHNPRLGAGVYIERLRLCSSLLSFDIIESKCKIRVRCVLYEKEKGEEAKLGAPLTSHLFFPAR